VNHVPVSKGQGDPLTVFYIPMKDVAFTSHSSPLEIEFMMDSDDSEGYAMISTVPLLDVEDTVDDPDLVIVLASGNVVRIDPCEYFLQEFDYLYISPPTLYNGVAEGYDFVVNAQGLGFL